MHNDLISPYEQRLAKLFPAAAHPRAAFTLIELLS